MFHQLLLMLCAVILLSACKSNDKKEEKPATPQGLAAFFKEATTPYQLSDTTLLSNTDTAALDLGSQQLLPDSLVTGYFGKKASLRYTPLASIRQKNKEQYYIVKAWSGTKKLAIVMVYDLQNNFAASYPFLVPDEDATTTQTSTIDKNLTITKGIVQRTGPDLIGEGKEVVAFDAANKNFSLIMMDLLNDNPTELVNPIDTFPAKTKWAGDYLLNKKNIVSVRDGRYPNQILVYIHMENEAGDCIGQLKGEFLMTSTSTAAFRQGGDPCVLGLVFKGNEVSINEETGCGNYRGLDCPLTGNFTRKKTAPEKATFKTPKRK